MSLTHIHAVGKPSSIPDPERAVVHLASLDDRRFVREGTFIAFTPDGHQGKYHVGGRDLVSVALLARPEMTVLELDEALDIASRHTVPGTRRRDRIFGSSLAAAAAL